jgi:Fe-S-cluster-containing dehydrogenase component
MEEVARDGSGGEYSVISYNEEGKPTQPFYTDTSELIKGCTTSAAEQAKLAGTNPPHKTVYFHPDYESVRRDNIVEKCILCDHRLKVGKQPYCVDSCPSGARVVGDIQDPDSQVFKLLRKHKSFVLKEEDGTSPNVYYIRDYGPR